jgi:predicted RNase H-like nuclease (RuvC/YqgF family)
MNDEDEWYYEDKLKEQEDRHERELQTCQREIRRLRWAVRELDNENDELKKKLAEYEKV